MSVFRLYLDLASDEARALDIANLLSEREELGPPAASAYDLGGGRWAVSAYFEEDPGQDALQAVLEQYLDGDARSGLVLEPIEDQDWVAATQAGLPQVNAGRFIVHGSHDRTKVPARRTCIEVDAGQAFGTAHHGTTRGCLMALDRLFCTYTFSNILDLGTGSGILAIACASSLPKARIVASDNDPVAIRVARDNARVNGVHSRIDFSVAEGLSSGLIRARAPFDLVIANILAAPLKVLAPAISRACAPDGLLILSGLLSEQTPEIIGRYRALGFDIWSGSSLGGWATLVFHKRNLRPKRADCTPPETD